MRQGDKGTRGQGDKGTKGTRGQGGQEGQGGQGRNSSYQPLATSHSRLPTPDSRVLLVLAQALNTQASLQLGLGQADTAFSTWQQAATVYERAGDRPGVIRSLLNQSQALQALGLYRRALETLTSADRSLSAIPDSSLKAAGLRQMGNLLRSIGDLPQSQQVLQRSLVLAQNSTHSQILRLVYLASVIQRSQRDNPTALAYYQQAATTAIAPIAKLQARLNQFSLLVDTQDSTAQSLIPEIQSLLATIPSSKTVYAQIDFAQSLMRLGEGRQGGQGDKEDKGTRGTRGQGRQRGQGDKEDKGDKGDKEDKGEKHQLPITNYKLPLPHLLPNYSQPPSTNLDLWAINELRLMQ
ncbi:MAG: hypothetical protein CLLPBCKN_008273 [Chroococcidiopsis cubana SAG 39.79]|uniref:tetratricopeptide repeat protein n=1 Tax=Chroococcidiopsis cubana TaxID=171392 RepID=UPI002AC5DD56|nr:tetratricopeptide repeat protein [Chroococcidiopsis cubana]MDZ4878835.1 hypothetical protein [Chroococcidiopsis cubana SAG 39.79]